MKRKIIISIIIFSTLFFCGCSKKMNITELQKQCAKDISTVQQIIGKSFIPSSNTLVIPAFDYSLESLQNVNDNNSFTSWNIVFSKPLTEEIISTYPTPEFPFQYTNIIATYTPRYTSTSNSDISGFNKFINKLENLYLQMQDSILVSNEISKIQKNFNFQLSLIKEKISIMQNKKEEISLAQLKNSQEILDELIKISKQLKESDSQLKDLIKEIDIEKNNLTLNTDTLSNKYIKVINVLDNKMSFLNNIQQCINQLDLIVIGNSNSNDNKYSEHYLDVEILKPISREEYINKYKEYYKSEFCLIKPNKKVPLPYIIDSNNTKTKQFM